MSDVWETIGSITVDAARSVGDFLESVFVDKRRAHLLGGTDRRYRLDWNQVHPHVTPADPAGGSALSSGYGSLNAVFLKHHEIQAKKDALTTAPNPFRVYQYALVETLNVTSSPRYEPAGKTYCNIYAYDFVVAMGGYLPRVWWYDEAWKEIEKGAEIITPAELEQLKKEGKSTKGVIAPVYAETVFEENANGLNLWIRAHGAQFGWREETDMTTAQEAANSGHIAVLLAANKSASESGHISVILAESDDYQAVRDKTTGKVTLPLQSQAGRTNFKYGQRPYQWWSDKDHKDGAAWIIGA
ncbi:MAG: hypothetical protein L0332_18575 [Chloroflexi bacterium]|nr:hypothetical protein [Chloroflexota bacterium]MCI0645542.1 hypothetical protein [Chloroflexota bacterium]MCI0728704.1 hypothetical protein [Chloroflexota bacterium]